MPYLNIAVILIAGMIAYIWSSRGFFSAFMHMLCVIVAGALAFAFWEPLALWMLGSDAGNGGAMSDTAWGIALGVPFALMLLVLRIACDKLVPFNLDFDTSANVVGGLVCGVVSGTISAGIVVMSVGYMRMDTNLLNFQRVDYGTSGSLERTSSLWYPADWLTCSFYSMLSNGSLVPLDSDATLGRLHPDLADENWLLRTTWEDGKGRSTISPDAFEITSHYTYTAADPSKLLDDHVNDDPKWTDVRVDNPQRFTYIDGAAASGENSYIEGFGVKFKSNAKEQSGRVVVGAGQVRLIVQRGSDLYDTMGIQPLAVNSQADKRGDEALKGKEIGRWRFDSKGTFVPSAREGNDTNMAFEFLVPKGSKPIALYVKGVRHDVSTMAPKTYETQVAHDTAIKTEAVFQPAARVAKHTDGKPPKPAPPPFILKKWEPGNEDIGLRNTLPFRTILQKDTLYGLTIDESRAIIGGGLAKYGKGDVATFGTDPKLQVMKFSVNDGSMVVQVRVDKNNAQWGFLSPPAAGVNPEDPVVLTDVNGAEFSPTGYVYKNEQEERWIYFSPQSPIMSMVDKDMPRMTASRPGQELVLIFLISKGTKLQEFRVGDRVIAKFEPPIEVTR